MHGHTLGAAGAIEAVLTAKALAEGLAPPTINFRQPDPACDLDVVPNEPRKADLKIAISNTFAFGGLNATLVLRRAPSAGK
jgi:3-oxoacyl-(acyl-carrier-protein) synthase